MNNAIQPSFLEVLVYLLFTCYSENDYVEVSINVLFLAAPNSQYVPAVLLLLYHCH